MVDGEGHLESQFGTRLTVMSLSLAHLRAKAEVLNAYGFDHSLSGSKYHSPYARYSNALVFMGLDGFDLVKSRSRHGFARVFEPEPCLVFVTFRLQTPAPRPVSCPDESSVDGAKRTDPRIVCFPY